MKQKANRKVAISIVFLMSILLVPTHMVQATEKSNRKEEKGVMKEEYKEMVASCYKKIPAGREINIEDILIAVTYSSGKVEIITGASNLCFVNTKDVINKMVKNKDGSVSKISETVTEESKTYQIKNGDNEITVRLKDNNPSPTDSTQEKTFHVDGIEEVEPEITDVTISEYELINAMDNKSKKAAEVAISITLNGKDNYSKSEDLLYALKINKETVADKDFSLKRVFEVKVKENCTYMAYVKDQAGNVAKKEIAIMIIDKEAPIIKAKSLAFKEEDGWVAKNIIYVEAEDNYKADNPKLLKYRFALQGKETNQNQLGTWREKNSIVVVENGIYTIEVKDSAGNITKDTIEVKDIDGEVPQIQDIEIKTVED